MLEIKDLLKKAKETMNKDAYEDFAKNTIKACGYNSDTFDLINNVKDKVHCNKYNDEILRNIKDCAKQNGIEDDKVEQISLTDNKESLVKSLDGIVDEENLNSILFDVNVEIVDDVFSYDKITGVDFLENIDNYLEEFKSGVDLIDNSDDYSQIKEDIYADAGLSTEGLENLDKDTTITIDDLDADDQVDELETEMVV